MIPTPKKHVVKFVNFDESMDSESDESSGTRIERKFAERTTEKWIDTFNILIAQVPGHSKPEKKSKKSKKSKSKNTSKKTDPKQLIGIQFPNGCIVYINISFKQNEKCIYAISESQNIFFMMKGPKVFIGLLSRGKCSSCNKRLKKVYRCFDCIPSHHGKADFCKACYTKREHDGHRAIALTLDEDLYEILDLEELIE